MSEATLFTTSVSTWILEPAELATNTRKRSSGIHMETVGSECFDTVPQVSSTLRFSPRQTLARGYLLRDPYRKLTYL